MTVRIAGHQSRRRRVIFVACVLLLTLTALGLTPALSALKSHYRKTSIQPRVPLADFNLSALASFKRAPKDSPFELPHTDEEAGGDEMMALRLQERGATGLNGQAYLVVTYYGDPEDRVPHTPATCYRLLGATIRAVGTTFLEFPNREELPERINVSTVIAEERGAVAVIAYVFCANARFYTGRNEVRVAMGMPGDKRWYFSKIEVVARAELGENHQPVLDRCLLLLREALPELASKHLPSRADVKQR
jgi:hypothetical protein